MSCSVVYEDRSRYLLVHVEGIATCAAAIRFWRELAQQSRTRKQNRFLIVDEVTGGLIFPNLYDWLTTFAIGFGLKTIAYVIKGNKSYAAIKSIESDLRKGVVGSSWERRLRGDHQYERAWKSLTELIRLSVPKIQKN